MEQIPTSLYEQRNQAAAETQAVFELCIDAPGLPAERKAENLINIAWSAAHEGLWDEFATQYARDALHDFVEAEGQNKIGWTRQFTEGGDFERAASIADSIAVEADRATAWYELAQGAAKQARVAVTAKFLGRVTNESWRQTVTDTLFKSLIEDGRNDAAALLADYTSIGTYALLYAAEAMGRQGQFETFLTYAKTAIAQAPTIEKRSDSGRGDWLERPVIAATKAAFITGAYEFISNLPQALDLPEDVKKAADMWIKAGVLDGTYVAEKYAAGLMTLAARAAETEEGGEVYETLQRAVEEHNWTVIELLAPQLDYEILCLLPRVAYEKGDVDTAMALQTRVYDTLHLDTSPVSINDVLKGALDETQQGNWDEVIALRDSNPRIFAPDTVRKLMQIAVGQERYEVLLQLSKGNDRILEEALICIDERGAFEAGDKLWDAWLQENQDVFSAAADISWLRLATLNYRAPHAAYLGDWPRVIRALGEMDEITRQQSGTHGHRGYEMVAIETLRTLQAVRQAETSNARIS